MPRPPGGARVQEMKPALESFTPLTAGLKTVRGRKSFFPRPVLGFRLKNLTKGKGKKTYTYTLLSLALITSLWLLKLYAAATNHPFLSIPPFPPKGKTVIVSRGKEREKKKNTRFHLDEGKIDTSKAVTLLERFLLPRYFYTQLCFRFTAIISI